MATAEVVTPSIAAGLRGKLTKENFGASMPSYAPTYPAFGPEGWDWLDIDAILIDYMTDAQRAVEWLPAQCELIHIPMAPTQTPVNMVFADYRAGTLPPYKEAIQTIPCLYKGQIYLYVAQIWVTTDSAMTSGREVGGTQRSSPTSASTGTVKWEPDILSALISVRWVAETESLPTRSGRPARWSRCPSRQTGSQPSRSPIISRSRSPSPPGERPACRSGRSARVSYRAPPV